MVHPVVGRDGASEAFAHVRTLWSELLDPHRAPRAKVASVLEMEAQSFDLPVGFLSQIDEATDRETFQVVTADAPPISAGNTIPLSRSYCRDTMASPDGTLVISHASAEGWEDDPAYEFMGYETYLGATVTLDDEPYGTLCFVRADARPDPIAEEEIALVDVLADWVGYELSVRGDLPAADPIVDEIEREQEDERRLDRDVPASLWPEEVDRLMDALARRPRRIVLAGLLEGSVETQADVLAATTHVEAPNGTVDAIELEHNHLPRLADAGFVEWDRETGAIEPGPEFDLVSDVLPCLIDGFEEID